MFVESLKLVHESDVIEPDEVDEDPCITMQVT